MPVEESLVGGRPRWRAGDKLASASGYMGLDLGVCERVSGAGNRLRAHPIHIPGQERKARATPRPFECPESPHLEITNPMLLFHQL